MSSRRPMRWYWRQTIKACCPKNISPSMARSSRRQPVSKVSNLKDGNPPSDDRDPGNPSVDFHGQKRSNATHQNATDSESRLCKKGKGNEAKLVLMAHALMENRNGLVTDFQVT